MTKDQFDGMLIWAREERSSRQELHWAWFQYLKLEETLGSIFSGLAASMPLGALQSDLGQESQLRLAGHETQRPEKPPAPIVQAVIP